jgi:hypothetical protein
LFTLALAGGCGSPDASNAFSDRIWARRVGGPSVDEGLRVAVDRGGNVYVLGQVRGEVDLGGGPSPGDALANLALASYTSAGAYRGSRRFVARDVVRAGDVSTDAAGNVYVVGGFGGTLEVGGETLTSAGRSDVMVASYSSTGALRWSRRYGGAEDDLANRVVTDAGGNVYLLGEFSTNINFGGGALTSAGSRDVFVASLSSQGALRWARRGGSPAEDLPGGLGVAPDGSVVIGGFYNGTADYGGGPMPTAGDGDLFVASYTNSGEHRWSRRFGGAESERFGDLAVGARGEVYFVGVLRGTADFGGGPLTAEWEDVLVVSLDRDGAHRWSRRYGTAGGDRATGIALGPDGNVYVTGDFSGFTVDTRSITLGGSTLPSVGVSDVFVASYTADGAHRASRAFGSGLTDTGAGIAVDARGNVMVTGTFGASAPVPGSPVMNLAGEALTATMGGDAFIAKLSLSAP